MKLFTDKNGQVDNVIGIFLGIIIFLYIIFVLISSGALSNVINSFSTLGPYGLIAGIMFVIALVLGIFQRIFE